MKSTEKKGFTLIETLVAVTLLAVAVAEPLTLAARGLSSSLLARDQITAFFLAQEGVELVRNARDTNALTGANWLSGIPTDGDGAFTVDAKTASGGISSCSGDCAPLNYDETTGFYTYSAGDASKFTRTITVETVSAYEVEILVTIEWQTGVFNRSFTIAEHISNWQ